MFWEQFAGFILAVEYLVNLPCKVALDVVEGLCLFQIINNVVEVVLIPTADNQRGIQQTSALLAMPEAVTLRRCLFIHLVIVFATVFFVEFLGFLRGAKVAIVSVYLFHFVTIAIVLLNVTHGFWITCHLPNLFSDFFCQFHSSFSSLSNSVASNIFLPSLLVITTVSSPSCSSHHLRR